MMFFTTLVFLAAMLALVPAGAAAAEIQKVHARPHLTLWSDDQSVEYMGKGGMHARSMHTPQMHHLHHGAVQHKRRRATTHHQQPVGDEFNLAQYPPPDRIEGVWSSTHDKKAWVTDTTSQYASSLYFVPESSRPGDAMQPNIILSPNERHQVFYGWGTSITDASAFTLQEVKMRNQTQYWEILHMLFDPSPNYIYKGGAGATTVRVPLSSTDFALEEYTFCDTADGSPDPDLNNFDINKSPKVWQTLLDILSFNKDLKIFMAPWSQPAWMKEGQKNGKNGLHGGQIRTDMHEVYARYLTRIMQALHEMRITPYRISLQNEPRYAGGYPGTYMEPDQQAAIGDLVRKSFDDAGFKDVGLLAWDHNWDVTQYPIDVFDKSRSFVGAAWHCYTSDASGQIPFTQAYRDAETHFTECTRITQYNNEPWGNLKSHGQQLLTGSINYGAQSMTLWNAALQSNYSGFTTPTLLNVCRNCLAPVLVDPVNGTYKLTSDFAALAQGSLATRIRDNEDPAGIVYKIGVDCTAGEMPVQAFERTLGNGTSRYSIVVLQQNDHYLNGVFDDFPLILKFRNYIMQVTLPVGVHTMWFTASSSYAA